MTIYACTHFKGTRLARNSDVLIENFKVGGLAKYGLGSAPGSGLKVYTVYSGV